MQTDERATASSPRQAIGYYGQAGLDGKHVGAILVTNRIGVPLEFKHTEPVAVTRMQKILYGAVLDRYLQETLLRDCLARELSAQPEYFVTDFENKDYLAPLAGREMIAVQELRSAAATQPPAAARASARESTVEVEDGPTLRVAFGTADEKTRQDILAWLKAVCKTMDVLEPLDRMRAALRTILADGRRR